MNDQVLRIERGMFNEREPVGPTRYLLGDVEITEERYRELLEQRTRDIEAGHCGIVD